MDPREMKAGPGRMPSRAYGENMDERVKNTRQIFLSKIPKQQTNELTGRLNFLPKSYSFSQTA